MGTVSLGKIAFSWRGPYAESVSYARQDVVGHQGDSWVCLVDGTLGVLPGSDAAVWQLFAQGSLNVAGTAGDLIYFDGQQLAALSPGQSGQVLKIDQASGLPSWGAVESRSGVRVKALPSGVNTSYRKGACVMEDGSVRFWGDNGAYMHGAGANAADRSYPSRAAFPYGAAPLEKLYLAYSSLSWAIDVEGKLWTWGTDGYGASANGTTVASTVPYCASDNPANSVYGRQVVEVASLLSTEGYPSTLVRTSDGKVHACGYNAYGQVGVGDTANRNQLIEVPLLSDIVEIAGGRERYTTYYALNASGELYAWGYNAEQQLGNGVTAQNNIPLLVPYFASNGIVLRDVVAAYKGCFAIDVDDNLYYWGTPENGVGGTGAVTVTGVVQVAMNVREVFTGAGANPQAFVIKQDGSVWASGRNNHGNLGLGITTDVLSFTEVAALPRTVRKIVCGGSASFNYALFLTQAGSVYACGYNGNGALGLGDTTSRSLPELVPIAHRYVVDVCSYGYSSEQGSGFLLDDGQLLQAGYAGESQLPEDDDEASFVPYPVVF